jgi:hypothetical protein
MKTEWMMGRRALLRALSAGAAATALPLSVRVLAAAEAQEVLLSAHGDSSDRYGFGWLNSERHDASVGSVASGFRGHGCAQHPTQTHRALMFARRPGTRGLEVDLRTGQAREGFTCGPGRHLFGHGCYSADGNALYTTEAEYNTGRGLVVVRDAQTYRIVAEWDSGGVGPHELALMPDGHTLVIANGGIHTHPASGREPLNLDVMASNLTYLDSRTGAVVDQIHIEESKASIRHLAVGEEGHVAFAIQMQREAANHQQLVALTGVHRRGSDARLFSHPEPVVAQLQDYMGSVVINNRARIAGFASPRGNLAVFWDIDDGSFKGYHRMRDVCGIANSLDQQFFYISNSFGQMRALDARSLREDVTRRIEEPAFRWDNHLSVVGLG